MRVVASARGELAASLNTNGGPLSQVSRPYQFGRPHIGFAKISRDRNLEDGTFKPGPSLLSEQLGSH